MESMDIIQKKLMEMEKRNPSINQNNKNFFQKRFNQVYFIIRDKLDSYYNNGMKINKITEDFHDGSIYGDCYERYKDYVKMVENLEVNDFEKDKLKEMLNEAKNVNGMRMARILRNIGPFNGDTSAQISKMAGELYWHSMRDNPLGIDPIYPNPVALGWTKI